MKVTVMPVIVDTAGTVTKGIVLDLKIRGQEKTIENTALLGSVRILGRVLET